ncbi:sorbosone dehydrogenase family protein, partial [Streptomyces sp. SM14]|uniref:PQQ-dependent sugar dehydrogenase n=1 Tax=Streptomyces sp. SM14 TaxID=1736045 RepID=UPI0015E18520
ALGDRVPGLPVDRVGGPESSVSPEPGAGGDDHAGGGGQPGGTPEPGDPDDGTGSEPSPDPTPTDPPPAPAEGTATVERSYALDGITAPWGLAELPDGDLLIGSRDTGTIHRLTPATGETSVVGTVQAAEVGTEAGLLGIETDEEHAYAFYSTASDSRIMRFVVSGDRAAGAQLSPAQRIMPGLAGAAVSNGGPLAFGPDGLLYASIGGGGAEGEAGFADVLARMTSTGAEPTAAEAGDEGGYVRVADADVRGFDWDAFGRLWFVTDQGELRVVEPGEDGGAARDVFAWGPGFAPGDITYSAASLWVSDLDAGEIWRVPLDGGDLVAEPTALALEDDGPLRSVRAAGDGRLWALTGDALLIIAVD